MSITIDSNYEIAFLIFGLLGFFWLAIKFFRPAVYLTTFFLPAYLLKINVFFAPFNVSEFLIVILFSVWLAKSKFKEIDREKIREFALPALIILIGTLLGVFVSENLKMSAGILKGWFLAPLALAIIVAGVVKTKKEAQNIFLALFSSAVFMAIISLGYYFSGRITFDGRLSGVFLSPNHLAMYLAPGLLLGLLLQNLAARKSEQIFIWTGLFVCGAAFYLTFSYAAWLSVLAIIFVWLAVNFFWSGSKKLFAACCLLFVVLLAALFFSQSGSDKFNNLLHSSRSSWQSRLAIWQSAAKIIKDNPIFGIGPGMFQEYYLKYQSRFSVPYLEWAVPQPHNLFLAFWLQTGILGLLGFFWLIFVFFRKIYQLLKVKNKIAPGLALLMGYTLLHGLFDTPYFKNDLAAIFWLMIALAVVLDKAASR